MQMTEQEMREAAERADKIVEKVRSLVALEDKVLEARASARHVSNNGGSTAQHQDALAVLESELEENVKELDGIADELKLATPSFKTYVLPQLSEIVGTLKASDTAEQKELVQLVAALTDNGNTQSLEQLEAIIIARLRNNLEKTFGP